MNIFKKRPLSLILCVMLGGFSLFVNTTFLVKLVVLIATALAFYFGRNTIKKLTNFILPCVLFAAFALSILFAQFFSIIFYPKFDDNSAKIEGQIIEVNEYIATYGLVVETTTINEAKDSHKLLVYVGKDDVATVERYDTVKFTGEITRMEFSEQFDADAYYNSRGISGMVENIEEFLVIEKGAPKLEYYFEILRDLCSERIEKVTTDSTSSFLKALVLGDKSDLDGNTKLNFKRIGISHILALSGMHLTIVCFGVMKLLSLIKINKNVKLIVVGVISVFYMALTGFSSTICRAAIMNLVVYALFLLRYKSDIFTSLLISVSVIVLFEPYAIFDISLQLSFLSMLGIIACTDVLAPYRPAVLWKLILFRILEGVAISVFANLAILPICVAKFGMISILGPVSTLMFSSVCTLLIYLGIFIILFGNFLFLGDIADIITKGLKWLVEFTSDAKWVYASANFAIVIAIATVAAIIFYGYLIGKVKYKRVYAIVFTSLYIVAIAISPILNTVQINKDKFEFTTEYADTILLKSEGKSALIYSGGNSNDSAYSTVNYLNDEYLSYLDCLIIQNYNTKLSEYVETVISRIKVDRILLLEPQNNFEKDIATDIAELLQYFGTNMRFYSLDSKIHLGDYTFVAHYHTPYQYGKSSESVYTITNDKDEVYTYVTEGTRLENYSQIMRKTDCLIIGDYGSAYSSGYLFRIKCDSIDKIIIGCNLRFDEITEKYYNEKGAAVYYTAAPKNLLD